MVSAAVVVFLFVWLTNRPPESWLSNNVGNEILKGLLSLPFGLCPESIRILFQVNFMNIL